MKQGSRLPGQVEMSRQRLLITGGAGFIGSHLCDFLLKKGLYVLCVDNFITGNIENIAHLKKNKKFHFIKHDISKPLNLKEGIDYVLHFASPASPIDYQRFPLQTLRAGSHGTENTLELARRHKAIYLLASTSEVYGDPLVHPQREEYFGNVNPVGRRACYDEAKRFAEAMAMSYRRLYKMDIKIARIFNTFGPRMRLNDGRVVPNFIYQALHNQRLSVYGDGLQTRSFCYVDDLIEGIFCLMQSPLAQPINLGNPREITILDFTRFILKITGSKAGIKYLPLPEDDPKRRQPDISRAIKYLKWQPKVSLEQGLAKTIAWFKARQEKETKKS